MSDLKQYIQAKEKALMEQQETTKTNQELESELQRILDQLTPSEWAKVIPTFAAATNGMTFMQKSFIPYMDHGFELGGVFLILDKRVKRRHGESLYFGVYRVMDGLNGTSDLAEVSIEPVLGGNSLVGEHIEWKTTGLSEAKPLRTELLVVSLVKKLIEVCDSTFLRKQPEPS